MKKKAIIKVLIILITIFAVGYIVSFFQMRVTGEKSDINVDHKDTLLVVRNKKEKNDILQNELKNAFERQSYVNRAMKSFERGDLDKAIKEFEVALSAAKMQGEKGSIIVHLADIYEAKRDYKKALEYVIVDRDQFVNDWAKAPVIERAKYLEYALNGEYELAVESARRAVKKDMEILNSPQKDPEYVRRLNDLKAAKEHILNLK